MQQAMTIAISRAQSAGAERINSVRMRVGALSGVVPDSLTLAFSVACQSTIAENAALDIEEVPVACYCASCEREFTPATAIYSCPACGRISRDIRAGREFAITSIEVD